LALHATHDPRETTAAGRRKFLASFPQQVIEAAAAKGEDLSEAEITRRAEYLRRAYFARLALKSAKVRRDRKASA